MFNILINNEINKEKERKISGRINVLTSHMHTQYDEHSRALENTAKTFQRLLDSMEEVVEDLKYSFKQKEMPENRVNLEIDSDRSVGILNILWNTMSFTTRGNTKPQAVYRKDLPPLMTGRIIALNGDFRDVCFDFDDKEYSALLDCEIASLYIPADCMELAIIRLRHLDKDICINQTDAPKEFLIKVMEIICGGGTYHENTNVCE